MMATSNGEVGESALNSSGTSSTLANIKKPLELYLVRISPPCRVVWMYLLQLNIPHVLIDVNFTADSLDLPDAMRQLAHREHNIPHVLIDVNFTADSLDLPDGMRQQAHREVPLLVDGNVVLFEGPVILNYLATTYTHHAGFGHGLTTRYVTESLCSWANSELHRAIGFKYVYPQFLEKYALPDHDHNEAMTEHALGDVTKHLETLEKRYLSSNHYLTGGRQTVADLFVATVLMQMEWTGFRFKLWPRVETWLSRVRHAEFWDTVHVSHKEFVAELERNRFQFD